MAFTPRARSHRGFTLIELAIVLVVIGLLVGGLMTARSYVKNAQLSTTVNEAKYYISAFGQFEDKYSAVPGDMPNATDYWTDVADGVNGNHNGDGNGSIRAGTGNNAELFYAFQHLALAGLIEGHFTGLTAGSPGTVVAKADVNVPSASANSVVFLFNHPDFATYAVTGPVGAGDSFYFPGMYSHVLIAAGISGGSVSAPFLTPAEAYKLDAKFDDGVPGQGWIMAPNTASAAYANCTTGSGAAYNSADTGKDCLLIMRLQ